MLNIIFPPFPPCSLSLLIHYCRSGGVAGCMEGGGRAEAGDAGDCRKEKYWGNYQSKWLQLEYLFFKHLIRHGYDTIRYEWMNIYDTYVLTYIRWDCTHFLFYCLFRAIASLVCYITIYSIFWILFLYLIFIFHLVLFSYLFKIWQKNKRNERNK